MGKRLYRRSILMLLIATFLAFSIAGLSVLFTRSNTAAAAVNEEKAPNATIHLGQSGTNDTAQGIYYINNFVDGWGKAIEFANTAASVDSEAYVKVILEADWTAAGSTSGFGNSPSGVTCFSSGRIYVPQTANIWIDLNGYKINRNLTSSVANGQVIVVHGKLTVSDSSENGTGVITGGYNNNAYAAGVYVEGGIFNLKSGSIEGNRISRGGHFGVGVVVSTRNVSGSKVSGTFNMYGGTIKNNKCTYSYPAADLPSMGTNPNNNHGYGGGVCVHDSESKFNMYDGVIEDNYALFGGGVASYSSEPKEGSSINIQGGIIRNNGIPVQDEGAARPHTYRGGGLFAYKGNITVENAEIYGNSAVQRGGGIYLWTNNSDMQLEVNGTEIHDNVVSSTNNTNYGGGIAIHVSNANGNIQAKISDSQINDNTAAYGGGLYAIWATVTVEDSQINGNKATNGGGVFVGENNSATKPSKVVLNSGSIDGNTATNGGGAYVEGVLELAGGSVNGNVAENSGGLYLGSAATVSLEGALTVAENYTSSDKDTPSNIIIKENDAGKVKLGGVLDDEANIHVLVDDYYLENGLPFIADYGKHNTEFVSKDGKLPDNEVNPTNGVWAYANPYRYFVSDSKETNQHFMVLKGGELGVVKSEVKFSVNYSINISKAFTFGKYAEDMPEWNYTTATYGDSTYPTSLTAPDIDGAGTVHIESNGVCNADVYTLTVQLEGGVEVEFTVVVKAKTLSESNVIITLPDDESYYYDGDYKTPMPTSVVYGDISFSYGTGYDVTYENNVNAGKNTAVVIVSFKGNYTGEARKYFTILPSQDPDKTTAVTWQIEVEGKWNDFAVAEYAKTFVYDGTDQRAKIRAYLTYIDGTEHIQTVYAYGIVVSEDGYQNTGMWLKFNGYDTVEFKAVGSYDIEIEGFTNYQLSSSRAAGITMNAQVLDIMASYFENYEDDSYTRLWQLEIGENSGVYTTLQDNAIYADPDATPDKFGEKVTYGNLVDAYARYRGVELALLLNPNYTLSNQTLLSYWLEFATVSYTDNKHVGSMGTVTKITTTVKIAFGSNYTVKDGGNEIVLTKTWYIVTISNNLRDATTKEEVGNTSLAGWTFGALSGGINLYEFRPEHGNTVIYSYYLDGSETPAEQFALVYSEETYITGREYYNVRVENGKFVLGSRIYEVDYLYAASLRLRSGTYRLEITVPQNEPSTASHVHWYDNDEVATDNGVIYYEFTFVFTLVIDPYALATAGGQASEGVEWTFPVNTVEYNGHNNNYSVPYIKLGNVTLIEGVDFALACDEIEVGDANLTVIDLHNPGVQFVIENAFTIVQGDNGWTDVPSIINWTYSSFNIDVNLIRATPLFDTENNLWFAISRDRDGTDIIQGLDHIKVDEKGHVDEAIAALLTKLSVGEYYLLGRVDETVNYRALKPNAVPFVIFAATNVWESKTVNRWVQGEYVSPEENLQVSSAYGQPHIIIKGDKDGKVYYDNFEGIDELATAKAGNYTLTASVEASDNYSGLVEYVINFEIFKLPGIPWWGILLIVIGALGLAAFIIFLLWKNGVFQIATEKFIVAIRTRASVEATMASIRAAKMMEEGRQSVEDAKRRERLEKLRQKEESQQELTPEEMAAQLEKQAKRDERKAEKLRERSEENRAQAAKLLGEDASSTDKSEEKSEDQKPENPTEE